ncbi:MAG: serine hydrolase domain-containing protein [Candidatus Dormiibacterota bacterium]
MTPTQVTDATAAYQMWLRFRSMMGELPSIAYGVSYQRRGVVLGAMGMADLGTGAQARADHTGYRVASITKTFTATLIMQLVEQGRVRVDEPVATYLPWLPSSMADAGITLRHLLTHSSGVIRDGSGEWGENDLPDQQTLRRDLEAGPTFAEPSVGFRYSNVAYALAGAIVEAVTELSFAEAIVGSILKPLGMRNSGTRLTPRLRKTLAVGYWGRRPGEPFQAIPATEARAFEPAGGLISTVPDLLRYQEAHFVGDSRLLSDLSKREMQRSQWQRDAEPHHGYGWMLWTVDGIRIRGHSGGYAGFSTRIGFAPEEGVAAVVLTNTLSPLPEVLVDGFFHMLSRVHSLWDAAKPRGTGGRAELGKFVGQYRGHWGERLVIRINGSLYLLEPSADRPLDEAARLDPLQGTARFLISEHEDYGNRGEELTFGLAKDGTASELYIGPLHYQRQDV